MKTSRVVGIAILAYFLYFAIGALRSGFSPDDMMNLRYYYERGLPLTLWNNVEFWSHAYRPMAGLYYLPVYYAFGLNPLPFRIVYLLILGANVFLSYRIAECLTRSQAAAALTAVVVCAHAGMVAIYYTGGFIYDVAAYFFTALMLFLYMRVRSQGLHLNAIQSAAVVCAYVAALNSKEIAVVGAGWILAYEFLLGRPRKLLLPLMMMALALIYTIGKLVGPGSLAQEPGYRTDLSFHRYFWNNRIYVNDILYTGFFNFTTGRTLVIAWIILTLACWRANKSEVWWCWFLVSTATLGVSFTVVPRNGPGLYIPLLAWALLISVLVTALFERPAWRWGAAAALAFSFSYMTVHHWRERTHPMLEEQRGVSSIIAQLRDLGKQPAPYGSAIFLNNPLPEFETYFIARLVWKDRTIRIELASMMHPSPTPAELDHFDWVLAFDGPRLQVVRAP